MMPLLVPSCRRGLKLWLVREFPARWLQEGAMGERAPCKRVTTGMVDVHNAARLDTWKVTDR